MPHHRPVIVPCVACLLFVCSAGSARAENTAGAQREIEAVYHLRLAAYEKRDANAYLANFSPAYQSVDRGGRVIRYAELRQRTIKSYQTRPSYRTQFSVKIQSVKLTGDRATVVAEEQSSIFGRFQKTNAPYKITSNVRLETNWSKQTGEWVELGARVLSYRYLREE